MISPDRLTGLVNRQSNNISSFAQTYEGIKVCVPTPVQERFSELRLTCDEAGCPSPGCRMFTPI